MNKRFFFVLSSIIIVLILLSTTFAGWMNTQVSASSFTGPGNGSFILPGIEEDPIEIPDSVFRDAICGLIGKPAGSDIYPSEVASVNSTGFAFGGRGITNITGIEYFTNVKDIKLCYNSISDATPLSGLAELGSLWITNNQLTSMAAFSGLPGLTELKLDNNRLDLTPGSADMNAIEELTGRGVAVSYEGQAQYTLTINGETGGCTVTKVPDLTTYYYDVTVNLTANAAEGWTFTGWGGVDTQDGNTATVVMQGDRTITAAFTEDAPPGYILNVITLPASKGSVVKNPDKPVYDSGETVNLTAEAAEGWAFSSWTGVDTQDGNTAAVIMNENKIVTSIFTEDAPPYSGNYSLEIIVEPPGGGHVNRYPWQPEFPAGTVVDVTAVPNPGWSFSHWSGNLTGSDVNRTVLMDMDKSITAHFNHDYCFLYTTIHGSGNIAVDPSKPNYNIGELITLTAVPAEGWVFAGWSGYVSSINNPIFITMDNDRYLTATFVNPNDLPPGAWWKGGGGGTWYRRAEIDIEEKSGANLANYQVKVEVPYRDNMKPDFSDIRFVMMDNITELSHWRQSFTPNDSACFWVKIPYIPASGTVKIYVYYGNPNALTASNIHDTFIFGDDFQDAAWTAANLNPVNFGGGTQGIEDGIYHMQGPVKGEPIAEPYENGSLKAFPPNYVAEIDFSPVLPTGGAFLSPRYSHTDDKYECWVSSQASYAALSLKVGGMWKSRGTKPLNFTITPGNWYALKTSIVMDREISDNATNYIIVYVNDSPYIAAHDDSLMYPGLAFLTFDWENEFHIMYDNFRVRAYATSEPTCEIKSEQMIALCAVSTIAAGNVSQTTASLTGSLDYLGFSSEVEVSFGWGTDESCPNTAEPAVMSSAGEFHATLRGLSPGTTYYFRAIGAGEFATTYGDTLSFTTASSGGGGFGGGGGGGGGGGPSGEKMITSLMNSITRDGKAILDIKASSPDLNVWLSIPQYTKCLNRVGAFLTSITIEKLTELPDGITDGGLFGAIYKFSPSGATFNPPITLTFRYKPSSLPDGMDVKKLKIVWWDSGKWVEMDTVVDTEKHTFSTKIDHFSYYSLMPILLPPSFEISNLTVPAELARGEEGTAEAVVTNTGDLSGSYKVALKINGKVNEEREITLDSGQEAAISFKLAFNESGTYTVRVNDIEKTLLVSASPAVFKLEGLTIKPEAARAGGEIVASVTVTNNGESGGECEIHCLLDGLSYARQKVTIGGGSSREVSFSIISREAGIHDININDILTGQFEISALPPTEAITSAVIKETSPPSSGGESVPVETEESNGKIGVIIVITAGCVLLAAIIAILVRHRTKKAKIKDF